MPNPKRPRDVNQLAKLILDIATGEKQDTTPVDERDPAAVKRGRKGGAARAASLKPKKRTAIAKKAARTRWSKKK